MRKFLQTLLVLPLFFSLSIHAGEVKVLKVKGEAYSNSNPITEGASLEEGAEVVVKGKNSFVHLRFEDGSMMLQKEGKAILKIAKPKKTLINLIKGKIFVFKNPKEKSKLNVKTKRAAMAVRGTKFYVEEGKETYLCVCEGKVAARNKKGTVDVTAGEDLFAASYESLEKKKAKSMMMEMASEGFTLMGIPVKQ